MKGTKKMFRLGMSALMLIFMALAAGITACGKGGGGSGGGSAVTKDMEAFSKAMSEGNLDKAMEIAQKAEAKQAKSGASPAGDFSYELTKDEKGIRIRKYDGAGGKVVIPAFIEGYPVVVIGERAIYKNYDITEVVVPAGVVTIGQAAFYQCENLTAVTLPAGLTAIGDSAFHECKNLTSVTLPDGLKVIPGSAFKNCSNLTTVNLPASLEGIGREAFLGCGNLVNLAIPDSLTAVKWSDFRGEFKGCGKLPIKTRQRLKELGYEGNF